MVNGRHAVVYVAAVLPIDDIAAAGNVIGQRTQNPCTVLQVVASQLGHQSARRVAVEPPVDQPLELRRRNRTPPVVIAEPEVTQRDDLADLARIDQLHGPDIFFIEQALLADIEHLTGLLPNIVHLLAFVDRIGHRLFAENMLAGAQSRNRQRSMRRQRHRDHEALYIRIFEQFVEIGIAFGTGAERRGFSQVGRIDIAQRDDLGFRRVQQVLYMVLAARTGTDNGQPRLFTRHLAARFVAARLQPRKHRQQHAATADQPQLFEKPSSVHKFF